MNPPAHAVAYLGFQKGGKFLLATSAHTKGAKPSFPIFSYGEKKIFAKGGNGPMPPKYATAPTEKNRKGYLNIIIMVFFV